MAVYKGALNAAVNAGPTFNVPDHPTRGGQ